MEVATRRVVTIPNLLSMLRLLGVPVFLWIVLWPNYGGPKHDTWALGILVASGITDYLDGKLARRLNQVSRLGEVLDPTADRLYILATLYGLVARDIIPVWLVVLLVARELLLAPTVPLLWRRGYAPPAVNFVGKCATFCLLYAFPLLLFADGTGDAATLASIFGWAFAWWGTALYWWSAVLYLVQTRRLVTGPLP